MSASPLTPQEREVMNALRGARPRRNLHIYAIVGLGVFFLSVAAYKALSRSSEAGARVAERPGPKASAEMPSRAALKELIEKQSGGEAFAKHRPESEPAHEPEVSAYPRALKGPAKASPTPGLFAAQGAWGQVPDKDHWAGAPPLELGAPPYSSPISDRSAGLERKLSEASYMTAKTEVYIQAPSPALGASEAKLAEGEADQAVTLARALSAAAKGSAPASDPLALLANPQQLGRLMSGTGQSAEQRIAQRVREQESFAKMTSPNVKEPVRATRIPDYPFVAEGTMIPAVTVQALASNLPGQIEARVVSDVYDSVGRARVLIPKGSRLIGLYNSNVAVGQERLQVAFTRIVFPSGASIALENSPAADRAGNSGMPGKVDHHFARIFGSALAVGFLTYALERRVAHDAAPGAQTAVNVYGGSASTPGTLSAQALANVTHHILDR
ncbi:MAG TPA: TrbI/VirB10 family protein, partial [Usitatibacter sp.]|nr:TrbI/VirB10 family protein [Usitatibacter sp.]